MYAMRLLDGVMLALEKNKDKKEEKRSHSEHLLPQDQEKKPSCLGQFFDCCQPTKPIKKEDTPKLHK